MTSMIYEQIGRLVVRLVRIRFRRQIRIAAVLGAVTAAALGYVVMSREPPEG